MRQKSVPSATAEQHVREIRRATRKRYSAEDNIRIVLSGLRGEYAIAELCRREGIAESMYYAWSKEFLEAGKKRLSGDTERQASSGEVRDLRMSEHNADLTEENRLLKKACSGMVASQHEIFGIGKA
jgi:transposase